MFLEINHIIFPSMCSLYRLTPGDLAVDHDDALSDPQEDSHVSAALPGVAGAAAALVTLCKVKLEACNCQGSCFHFRGLRTRSYKLDISPIIVSQQWLWEQTMRPHTRHRAGVLLSLVTLFSQQKLAAMFIRSA